MSDRKPKRNPDVPIKLNVGGYPVAVYYAPNQVAFAKAHKKFKIKPVPVYKEDEIGAVHDYTGCLKQIVVIEPLDGTNAEALVNICCHEAVHVWQNTKVAIGEKFPGIEQEAYFIATITEQLFKSFLDTHFEKSCVDPELDDHPIIDEGQDAKEPVAAVD